MRPTWSAWWLGLAVACTSEDDDGGDDPTPCTYEELGTATVDEVAAVGFTAAEVIALANTKTTGDALGAGLTETTPAELDHRFSTLGDATEIAYDTSEDPSCPQGQALSVPVSYVVDGSVGDWWVQGPRLWLTLIATALDVDAIQTGDLAGGMENLYGGAADSGLEDLARTTFGLSADCVLGFGVGPSAAELFPAPGGPNDGIRGWISVACDGTAYGDLLTWTAERVVETP